MTERLQASKSPTGLSEVEQLTRSTYHFFWVTKYVRTQLRKTSVVVLKKEWCHMRLLARVFWCQSDYVEKRKGNKTGDREKSEIDK